MTPADASGDEERARKYAKSMDDYHNSDGVDVEAVFLAGLRAQRERDAEICMTMADRKSEAAAKAEIAGHTGVASHRTSDAETAWDCAKAIREGGK